MEDFQINDVLIFLKANGWLVSLITSGIIFPIARSIWPRIFSFVFRPKLSRLEILQASKSSDGIKYDEALVLKELEAAEVFRTLTGLNTNSHQRNLVINLYSKHSKEFSFDEIALASRYFDYEDEISIKSKTARLDLLIYWFGFIAIILLFLIAGIAPALFFFSKVELPFLQFVLFFLGSVITVMLVIVITLKPYRQATLAIKLNKLLKPRRSK